MDRIVYHYLGFKYDNGCVFDCNDKLPELPDWLLEIMLERHPTEDEFEHAINEMTETSNWRKL
jgi:hypothetical protein